MRRMSLVGIDIGSSAVKAAAYDADGALLAQATEAVPSLHPGPGLAEVDGDAVWKAVVAVVQQVTAGERVRRDPPAALAVSASGREGFPARADGSALGPCLRTADARRPETEAAVTLKRSSERWIRDCGHVPDHMDPTNRILWWAEQAPRTMSRARWFLGWHELVSLRLTGRPTVDPALASGFLIFDLAAGAWSAERIEALRHRPPPAAGRRPLGHAARPGQAADRRRARPAAPVHARRRELGRLVRRRRRRGDRGGRRPGGGRAPGSRWWRRCPGRGRARWPRPGFALTRQPSTPGWGLWARSPNGTSVLDWALGVSGIRLNRLEAALAASGPDPSPAPDDPASVRGARAVAGLPGSA